MKIAVTSTFLPGNIHTRRRAMQLQIAGAAGVTVTPEAIANLSRALKRVRLQASDCPAWRRMQKAKGPVPFAALVEVLAVVTQRYTYWPVKFCSWREAPSTHDPDRTDQLEREGIAIYEIASEPPGRAAADAALAVAQVVLEGADAGRIYDEIMQQWALFLKRTRRETPAGDTLQIAGAATRQGIPWSILHHSTFLRLGWGANAQVLIGTESSHTSSMGRALASNKALANRILAEAGLPVADQRVVNTAKQAVEQAGEIGYPLVVKPLDGNMGKGVTIGITDKAQLAAAVTRAQKFNQRVVMERFIEGEEYRLLVIDHQMIAAACRRAAQVVGDGRATVRALVARENQRPERESLLPGRMSIMRNLQLDDDALGILKQQGLTPDSVPAADQVVYLRRESNISRGGEALDVTHRIHPDNRVMAGRAARAIGLDVCGVDFISPDPSVPWHQNGGAICEVNSRPGANMQIQMGGEGGSKIPTAILSMLFPEGSPSRMPVVALLGKPDQTRVMRRLIEQMALTSGSRLGVLTSEPETELLAGTRALAGIGQLEWDKEIDAVVIEATADQIVSLGLGVERVELAVVALGDGSDDYRRASHVLRQLAGPQVVAMDDPGAVARIAQALALSTTAAVEVAADAAMPHSQPVTRKAPDKKTFTALFMGDTGFGESYMHRRRAADLQRILGTCGHGYSLANLRGLLGLGDLNIANLEVPLSGRPDAALQGRKEYLGWCDPERTVAALQQAGIDAVTLANNHTLDCGVAGLSETLTRLDRAGIEAIGAGPNEEAAAHPMIHRFSVGGVERSLVILAGFQHRGRYDRRYHWYASRGKPGVAMISAERMARQIETLRQILPDPTFVAYPHWGMDYAPITELQRRYAAELAQTGVDLVIGHGAHVAQPFEMIDGCPVLFNLGNFIWNTPGRFDRNDAPPFGAVASLTFSQTRKTGARLRIYPIVTDNMVTGFQNRPVNDDEFEDAAALIGGQMARPPRRQQDEVGHFLEIPLRFRKTAAADQQSVAAQ